MLRSVPPKATASPRMITHQGANFLRYSSSTAEVQLPTTDESPIIVVTTITELCQVLDHQDDTNEGKCAKISLTRTPNVHHRNKAKTVLETVFDRQGLIPPTGGSPSLAGVAGTPSQPSWTVEETPYGYLALL